MAKQKFKITIQLKSTGSANETTRVSHANDAAKVHGVTAQDDKPLDGTKSGHRVPPATNSGSSKVNDIIVWHVKGELADVLAMCLRWSGAAGTDSVGSAVSAFFRPTISVLKQPEPE
jgi:hypothetical protein